MKVIPLDEEALDAVEFLGWDNLELMNQKLGKEYLFYIDTDDSYHHLVFDEEEEAVGSEEIDIEPELGDWFVFHEDGTLVILEEEDFLESYRPKNQKSRRIESLPQAETTSQNRKLRFRKRNATSHSQHCCLGSHFVPALLRSRTLLGLDVLDQIRLRWHIHIALQIELLQNGNLFGEKHQISIRLLRCLLSHNALRKWRKSHR